MKFIVAAALLVVTIAVVNGISATNKPSSDTTPDIDLTDAVARLTEELQRLQSKVSKLEILEARVVELEKRLQQKCGRDEESVDVSAQRTRDVKRTPVDPVNSRGQKTGVHGGIVGLRRGVRQNPEAVAFSAVVSKHLEHLGSHQIVKYDKIIKNTGGGYSANSGVFTTPTAGTYLFLYHLGHHGTGETWVEIMKNGAALNGFAVEGTDGEQNLQGGNSVVLDLAVGDEVWVQTFQVNDVHLRSFFTTFSGVLLS